MLTLATARHWASDGKRKCVDCPSTGPRLTLAVYIYGVYTRDMETTAAQNQPATPVTAFRIPPDLKARAAAKAAAEGVTLTSVIIRALERYVKSK